MDADEFEACLKAVVLREIAEAGDFLGVKRLTGGANQETYRITINTDAGEKSLAFRRAAGGELFSPGEIAPGLATEALLFKAAQAAGVPEPTVYYVLAPSDGLGEGFIMEWLEGETLGSRIARHDRFAEVRPNLARQCGEILGRIHAIDLAATGLDKALESRTPRAAVDYIWERYQSFETPQPMIDFTARWLLDHLPPENQLALVHNDFRNGNLMIDESGVIAVLDWEIAHIGDPMRDLGWICTNSWRFGVTEKPVGGFGEVDDLIAGYEAAGGRQVDREQLHFWEVYGSFWWAVGCLGMQQKFREGVDATVERPAIARRSSECQIDCVNLLIPGAVDLVAAREQGNDEMPRVDEILASVRDFLRDELAPALEPREKFMSKVAANALDITLREETLGPAVRSEELRRLRERYASDGDLNALRWRLVEDLRAGVADINDPMLHEHLRQSVVNQVAIDQPNYSGFATALAANAARAIA